jgi:glycerate kinase
MRVLIAPDKFRGTITAARAALAIEVGWLRARPDDIVARIPMADGGEGTLDALLAASNGRRITTRVTGPLGDPVDAPFGMLPGPDGPVAVVEMSRASGIGLLGSNRRDPTRATTRGTGELIRAALAERPTRVVVAVGGSATTDGGAGAIEAIRAGGGIGAARLVVLCDVELAFEDAARVFGPQKGAGAELVARLEERLAAFAASLPRDPRGVRATGCAGGLSGGLWAAFDAELRPGAPAVLDALRVDERMHAAQLVVAGEGCVDGHSFGGKIVGELVRRGRAAGVPVHAVAGTSALSGEEAAAAGLERVWIASTLDEIAGAGRALGGAALRRR